MNLWNLFRKKKKAIKKVTWICDKGHSFEMTEDSVMPVLAIWHPSWPIESKLLCPQCLNVTIVGTLTEHPDGRIDLQDWIADIDIREVEAYKQEFIMLTKQAGTYTYKED